MPHTWKSLITYLSNITKENYDSIICCTHCGNRDSYVKWGFYSRYLFNDELVKVQRYRCDNDLCPRRTFSVLPHAFLPIVRVSLCMLMYVLQLYEKGHCVAHIARCTGNEWPRIRRWISKAILIREWLSRENKDAFPCLSPNTHWPPFTRNFYWAFYPNRVR